MTRRLLSALLCALAVAGLLAGPAAAFWSVSGSGSGSTSVDMLDGGNTPTASVSGQAVTVSWAQTWFQGNLLGTFQGGGYSVRRYPAAGGPAVPPNTACDATIAGSTANVSCQEDAVPPGSWEYTVTPSLGSWTGRESVKSTFVTVGPIAPVLSSVAAQSPAAGQSTGAIAVSWSSVSTATGYNIYRRSGSGSFDFSSPLNGALPVTSTAYTDPGSGLTGGVTYAYVVRSVAGTNEGGSSNERSATAIARPGAPASVTATPGPAGQIAVGWPGGSGAAGYNVYRRTSTGAYNYAAPLNGSTPTTATSFTDPSTANGVTYRYVVRSVKNGAAGEQVESTSSAESPAATADSLAPTGVSLSDPGSPLRGTVTVSGSASDSGSGVTSVRFQYAPAGTSTWSTGCTATTSPYSCSLATNAFADGLYDLRALATDAAGNATTSTLVANRRVDNTAPSATMNDPGAFLRATVTLTATAADSGTGLASLRIEGAPTGTITWSTVCTVATGSASCPLNTTTLANGGYDLRAVATDVAGNSFTSPLVTNRVVDNTAPTGTDIQTTNVGGGTPGKPEAGDTVRYSFSEPISPASILAGWSGAATPVTVRFTNGNPDVVTVFNAANTTQLGLGSFTSGKQHVTATTTFTGSSMVFSGNMVTVTLGTPSVATGTATAAATLNWSTSAAATDRAGNPVTAGTVPETGLLDLDF